MITVRPITSQKETEELDQLLWETLWNPLGLPRNVRDSFKLEGSAITLAAMADDVITGGLVAVWTSAGEVEIRHLAVAGGFQKQGVGACLIESILNTVADQGCTRIHTIARSISSGFFAKMGFSTAPGTPPEHPDFKKHGITFVLMEKVIF